MDLELRSMNRELKRVAMDFSAPIGKVWTGYLNPYSKEHNDCEHCRGSGYSPEASILHGQWYGKLPFRPEDNGSKPFLTTDSVIQAFAKRQLERCPEYYGEGEEALEKEALRICTLVNARWSHHLNEKDVAALIADGRFRELPEDIRQIPAEVNAAAVLGSVFQDSSSCWVCIKARCESLHVPYDCAHCNGVRTAFTSPEAQRNFESWVADEPPPGPGYQMWSTTSEGAPISPVFETPEALAEWLSTDDGSPKEDWLRFIMEH